MEINLPCGIYQHYKGKKYLVLGLASHTENGEYLVIYVPLYEHAGAAMAARPASMFLEDVIVNGEKQPRFRYLGNEF